MGNFIINAAYFHNEMYNILDTPANCYNNKQKEMGRENGTMRCR